METNSNASVFALRLWLKPLFLHLQKEMSLHSHLYKQNEKLESELALQKKKYWFYYYCAFVWGSADI